MLEKECLFCKMIRNEIPSEVVYEDEQMRIIKDIAPKAKNHYLLFLKDHFKYLSQMTPDQADVLARCLKKIGELKEELHLENGFRCVINQGDDAGQTVPHLHVHILSGQKMDWNPA